MSSNQNKSKDDTRRCSYCGVEAGVIWVHGHGQCAACGINVEECCRGEQCKNVIPGTKSPLLKGE